jgi:ribosomal protein L11
MKPFNLEIILKRSRHIYKKQPSKIIKFTARVTASAATKQPPLGSILGTNGINADNFCQKFNEITFNYTPVILPVHVVIHGNKSYTMDIGMPAVHTLFKMLETKIKTLPKKRYWVGLLLLLYKISIIKKIWNMRPIQRSVQSWDIQGYGKLKSSNKNPKHFYRKPKK